MAQVARFADRRGLGALPDSARCCNLKQFGFSWLVAFMFFLSLGLGALFLVLVHHLFDAGWSVATRRLLRAPGLAAFPWLAILFLPIALLAPKIYAWMRPGCRPTTTRCTPSSRCSPTPGFYLAAVICFAVWGLFDQAAEVLVAEAGRNGLGRCTHKMRFHSYWGIFLFAFTLTLGGDHVDEGAATSVVLHDVWRAITSRAACG